MTSRIVIGISSINEIAARGIAPGSFMFIAYKWQKRNTGRYQEEKNLEQYWACIQQKMTDQHVQDRGPKRTWGEPGGAALFVTSIRKFKNGLERLDRN